MYVDGLSFLEDEREAWRPFEALADLDDDALTRPLAGAHAWSGRDLMGHLLACHDVTLQAAKELAVGETSPTMERVDREWDERGGDVVNAELLATWAAVPLDELRERFRTLPGELRGYLTVVPESRWIKHAAHQAWIAGETLDHYPDHEADLAAILAAAAASAG